VAGGIKNVPGFNVNESASKKVITFQNQDLFWRLNFPDKRGKPVINHYSRGEVGKVAEAEVLAAVSQIDISWYQKTGEIRFLPDVYQIVQSPALMNSDLPQKRTLL
jgi:hypothetical protein